jgi:hypothetical protein
MRSLQFWILLLGSVIVSGLMIKQIFMTRELNRLHRTLAESQQVISEGSYYQNAWQKLALSIYEASRQDPTLAAVLKKENVGIHAAHTPDNGSTTPAMAPVPQISSKATVAPAHPVTP